MPELTFRSPGVSTREIDLSGPRKSTPVGTPAGVVGTANDGPAFVPVTVGNYSDFAALFGASDGEKFGPLAVNEWLKNASACTYVRVLGAGNGKKRNTTTGKVTNAGFTVGEQQVQPNGQVGANAYANGGAGSTAGAGAGPLGRTYFLGSFMSQSAGSDMFSDAGIVGDGTVTGSMSILRGIVMAPSGVVLTLSGNLGADNSDPGAAGLGYDGGTGNGAAALNKGSITGSMKIGTQAFVMLLNGHKGSSAYPRVVTASLDYRNPDYFANTFNTDPYKIEQAGHYLYARYDIHPNYAVPTGSGVLYITASEDHDGRFNDCVYLTTGAFARNNGSSTAPNYECWTDRFTTAFSPFVISQDFGGAPYEIFRVEALSDGAVPTTQFKISIENIKKSNSDVDKFGSFDMLVRQFEDSDDSPVVLEAFRGMSLDPTSARFAPRVVGDQKAYFNFDANSGAQKLIVEGDNPNRSSFVRIKQSTALKKGELPDETLPMGFRGPYHLVTSGTGPLHGFGTDVKNSGFIEGIDWLKQTVEPPLPLRETVALGTGQTKRANASLYWGVQFSYKEDVNEPNKVSLFNPTMYSYAKFYPRFEGSDIDMSVGDNPGKADVGGTVYDSDRFNNNKFTLENLRVRTGSDTLADPSYWLSASYIRKGGNTITVDHTLKTRAFTVNDLKSAGNRNYAKFTFFLQGGFDGTNIFGEDEHKLNNASAIREMDDSDNQGGIAGNTVASFRKAVDIMATRSDVSIKLLAIPGMRETGITDYAIDAMESRFDALYLMDIEERDTLNTVITGSDQVVHVKNTTTDFNNRALDTSFAAAYFPDVIQQDPGTLTNVRCPPSVAVLGAFALNDAVGHPWFAPAGFSRGALNNAQRAVVELKRSNLDDLYDADINPLTDFPGTGLVVFGQKTLLQAASALDRVNVRRLLIEIRRSVRSVANSLLFEPNRQETLDKFNALVNPILQGIQEQNGLDRFKVVIDTTTTTQADIENNTIRGKIFLQPTRTIEFIALDFVVTNAGATV
jgi:phage tail sheath protein FI